MAIQRCRNTECLGRAEVLNGHGVGGVHAFEEGVGFGRALGDNGRIGKDGQLVGERVFFVNGVAAVFIGVIQTEGQVPTVTGQDVGRVGCIDNQLNWIAGDPRLSTWKRDS